MYGIGFKKTSRYESMQGIGFIKDLKLDWFDWLD